MWDIESIAAGIQECVGPNGLDWESVLGRLDRPGFFVADSRGVDAIAELYNRCTSTSTSTTNERPFPGALFLGVWANKGAQLSFLRAASLAREPVLAGAGLGPGAWGQRGFVEALLRLSEDAGCAVSVRMLFETPLGSAPEDLFVTLAGCREGPKLRLLLEKTFFGPRGSAATQFGLLWARASKAVLAVLCDMYAADRATLGPILAAVASSSEARAAALPVLLEATPPAFAVDLAAHAYAQGLVDVERWLAEKARSPPILAACSAYVLERAAAKDVEAPYAALLRGVRACNEAEFARLSADPAVVEALQAQRTWAIERRVKALFASVYSGRTSVAAFVDSLVAVAERGAASGNGSDNSSGSDAQYRYTVNCILEEHTYVDRYSQQSLRISADVLGELVARGAVRGADLVRAVQNVLDAITPPPADAPPAVLAAAAKRFQYGATALAHFVPVLGSTSSTSNSSNLSAYAAKFLRTQGFEDLAPELYARVAAVVAAAGSGGTGGGGSSGDAAIPPKMRGVLNTISTQNVDRMARDFRRGLAGTGADHRVLDAVAQNLLQRIIGEESHHAIYAAFLDHVNFPRLSSAVMAAVYAEVRSSLAAWGVSADGSTETAATAATATAPPEKMERAKKHLAALGKWVGLVTLGRDVPIQRTDVDLRALLLRTRHTAALEAVLPFVSNVLVCCRDSAAFRPPNSWLCSLLRVLADIRAAPRHREKTKHEIDRIFDALGIKDSAAYASHPLSDSSGSSGESIREATLSSIQARLHGCVRVGCAMDGLRALAAKKAGVTNAAVPAIAGVTKAALMRLTVAAVARVVETVCRGEVPRAAEDAAQATESMVLKDLAHDPSEERLVTACTLMAKHLAGGMALVSCRHTLAKLMIERLAGSLADSLLLPPSAGFTEAELADVAKLLVYENFDAACTAVSRRAEEAAEAKVLEKIADERAERREYCRCRPHTPFTSASWRDHCAKAVPGLASTRKFLAAVEKSESENDNAEKQRQRQSQRQKQCEEVYRDFERMPILIPRMSLQALAATVTAANNNNNNSNKSNNSNGNSNVCTPEGLRAAVVEQVDALVTSSQQISRGLDMLTYEEVCTQYLLCLKKVEAACAQRPPGPLGELRKGDPVRAAAEDLEYALDYALRLRPGQEGDRSTLLWPLFRYLIDATTPEATQEALLLALRGRPKVFRPAVSSCFLKLPQEKKFFPGLIPTLLGARLLDQALVDNAIFNAMPDAPSDQVAAYAVDILRAFVLAQQYPPTDFERAILTLAAWPSLSPAARKVVEAAKLLLAQQHQKIRNNEAQQQQLQRQVQQHIQTQLQQQQQQRQTTGGVVSNAGENNGSTTTSTTTSSNACEGDGQDGLRAACVRRFYEWCEAVESKDEGRMRETLVRVERGLEGSEAELMRHSFDEALQAAQLTSPDAPGRYRELDAYGGFVVYLCQSAAQDVRTQLSWFGEAMRLFLQRLQTLGAEGKSLAPLMRLLCFWAGHADVLPVNRELPQDQRAAMEPLTIYFNLLASLHPLKEPGLAFGWLEAISNKVLLRRALSARQNWGLVQRPLVELMRFLSMWLHHVRVITDRMHLFIEGAAQLLAVIREAYPEFLAAYHFSLCNAIPDALANLRSVILSATPTTASTAHTAPFVFPSSSSAAVAAAAVTSVDQLPGAAEPPLILDDYVNVLKGCAPLPEVDACIAAPDTASYAWVAATFFPCLQQAFPSASCFNALVLYVGDAIVKAPASKNNAFRFLRRFLALLSQPQHSYLLLSAIANQLRYPNAHTLFFSKALASIFASPTPSSSSSSSSSQGTDEANDNNSNNNATNGEFVKEQILRVLCERVQRTQVQPWGLMLTWIEILLNPTYRVFDCKALADNPSVGTMLRLHREKFIELFKSASTNKSASGASSTSV